MSFFGVGVALEDPGDGRAEQRVRVEGELRPARAHQAQDPGLAQPQERTRDDRGHAGGVEGVLRAATGEALHLRTDVDAVGGQHHVRGAELEGQVEPVLVPVDGDDRRGLRHLRRHDGGEADAAHAVDGDAAAGLHVQRDQHGARPRLDAAAERTQDREVHLLVDDQIDFLLWFLLLVDAGGDTTRNLVGGGLLALFEHPEHPEHPEQLTGLRADVDGLLPSAIEELLRYVGPLIYMRRRATRDTELRGTPIAEGDRVVMYYGAANRQPQPRRVRPPARARPTAHPPPPRGLRWRRTALLPPGPHRPHRGGRPSPPGPGPPQGPRPGGRGHLAGIELHQRPDPPPGHVQALGSLGQLVPRQATFARFTSSRSASSWAWRFRQMM
jgi:cytochrome P450